MRAVRLALGILLSTAGLAAAQPTTCNSTTGRSVSVTGSATLRLVPDRVSFSVGVETIAPTVSEALRSNNAKLNAVVAALKAKGVQPKEMQTSNLDITPWNPDGRKVTGYRVANVVSVTREDPNSVGELIETAVGAGANQAGGLRFFVAEPGRHQARGLDLAFQSARAKAESLASYSKRALGDVVCVAETGPVQVYNRQANFQAMDLRQGPAIEIGTEELTFSVSVVFELK